MRGRGFVWQVLGLVTGAARTTEGKVRGEGRNTNGSRRHSSSGSGGSGSIVARIMIVVGGEGKTPDGKVSQMRRVGRCRSEIVVASMRSVWV